MKKLIIAILFVVVVAFAANSHSFVYPRCAVGKTVANPSYHRPESSYADVIQRAPIIAEVEVEQYFGSVEPSTGITATLYEVRVLVCYKNETGRDISRMQIIQDGTAELSLAGYTLFQTGDRLLLALDSCENGSELAQKHLRDCYFICGGALTAMEIVESEDGDVCRTFAVSLTDLPQGETTAVMRKAAFDRALKKNTVPDNRMNPEYTVGIAVPYQVLKQFILSEVSA